ncbi:MAG: S24 family peptidase [Rhodobiaceae bacterium]
MTIDATSSPGPSSPGPSSHGPSSAAADGNGLDPARRAVRLAVDAAGLTLKEASRALGRNDAYLQQFLYRRSPRRLPEQLRLRLAALTATDQSRFLDPDLQALQPARHDRLICVPLHAVHAAAGGGSFASGDDEAQAGLSFPPDLLRRITAAPAGGLKLLSVSGDSMSPTLEDGDLVIVDTGRRMPSPPGIFILDDGVGLVAKRVDAIPNTTPPQLRLSSDNPAYSNYQRRIDEVHIVGRIVWFARNI